MKTILALICLLIVAVPGAFAGTYLDRDGNKHPWVIDEAHTLVWDGSPYLPFGMVFRPRYLSSEQTDENLAADRDDLEAFTLAGVKDVVIRSGKGVSSIPVEAWQKIIDLLEESGLTYGIELDDSPYTPLVGYVIDPTANRIAGIKTPGVVTKDLPDTKLAFYALCDTKSAAVVDLGQALAAGGTLSVQANVDPGVDHTLLIYPQKVIGQGSQDWSLPDLWSDVDTHRDRLVSFLPKIRFGKGLRFFTDPFGERLGLRGEVDALFPTSPGFRMEYAAWLSRKYRTVDGLKSAWSVLNHEVASFDEAVALIPMWRQGRGLAAVYDDRTGRKHDVEATRTSIWNDLDEFRGESVRGYMDGIADVLKRMVADVPVVFTANGLEQFFQEQGTVGYDGLAVPVLGLPSIQANGGNALSMAEHSSRSMWLLSRIGGDGTSFQKKDELSAHINGLRDLGVKGFFMDESAVPKQASGADVLLWLAEYGASAASDKQFAAFRPRAIYYPYGMPKASARKLSGGAWWLPSLLQGRNMVLGSKLSGYVILMPGGELDLYVWAPGGPTTIHIPTGNTAIITRPSGERLEIKPKKNRVELPITDEPSLIAGIQAETFLPVEVVEEAVGKLREVIAQAEAKNLDVSGYKDTAKRVDDLIKKNSLFIALDMAQVSIDELTRRLQGLQNEPNAGAKPPAGSP